MASTSAVRAHTTQAHPAYEPSHSDVSRPWQLLIVGLLLVAIVAISVRSPTTVPVPWASTSPIDAAS